MPDQNVGDAFDVVDIDDRNSRRRQWRIGSDGDDRRVVGMHELRGAPELSLGRLLEKLAPVDLVLVEGFKREAHPKLEVYRASIGKPLLAPDDPHIVAIASDAHVAARVAVVSLDDAETVADILLAKAVSIDAALARVNA